MFRSEPKVILLAAAIAVIGLGVALFIGREVYLAINPSKRPIKTRRSRRRN